MKSASLAQPSESTVLLCKPDIEHLHREVIQVVSQAGFLVQAKSFRITPEVALEMVKRFPSVAARCPRSPQSSPGMAPNAAAAAAAAAAVRAAHSSSAIPSSTSKQARRAHNSSTNAELDNTEGGIGSPNRRHRAAMGTVTTAHHHRYYGMKNRHVGLHDEAGSTNNTAGHHATSSGATTASFSLMQEIRLLASSRKAEGDVGVNAGLSADASAADGTSGNASADEEEEGTEEEEGSESERGTEEGADGSEYESTLLWKTTSSNSPSSSSRPLVPSYPHHQEDERIGGGIGRLPPTTTAISSRMLDSMNYEELLETHIRHLAHGGTCLVVLLTAPNAVERLKELVGPENPEEARRLKPGSLRARLGTDTVRNGVHAATSLSEASTITGIVFGYAPMLCSSVPSLTTVNSESGLPSPSDGNAGGGVGAPFPPPVSALRLHPAGSVSNGDGSSHRPHSSSADGLLLHHHLPHQSGGGMSAQQPSSPPPSAPAHPSGSLPPINSGANAFHVAPLLAGLSGESESSSSGPGGNGRPSMPSTSSAAADIWSVAPLPTGRRATVVPSMMVENAALQEQSEALHLRSAALRARELDLMLREQALRRVTRGLAGPPSPVLQATAMAMAAMQRNRNSNWMSDDDMFTTIKHQQQQQQLMHGSAQGGVSSPRLAAPPRPESFFSRLSMCSPDGSGVWESISRGDIGGSIYSPGGLAAGSLANRRLSLQRVPVASESAFFNNSSSNNPKRRITFASTLLLDAADVASSPNACGKQQQQYTLGQRGNNNSTSSPPLPAVEMPVITADDVDGLVTSEQQREALFQSLDTQHRGWLIQSEVIDFIMASPVLHLYRGGRDKAAFLSALRQALQRCCLHVRAPPKRRASCSSGGSAGTAAAGEGGANTTAIATVNGSSRTSRDQGGVPEDQLLLSSGGAADVNGMSIPYDEANSSALTGESNSRAVGGADDARSASGGGSGSAGGGGGTSVLDHVTFSAFSTVLLSLLRQ